MKTINVGILDTGLSFNYSNPINCSQINIRAKKNKCIYPKTCKNTNQHCEIVHQIITTELHNDGVNPCKVNYFIYNILDNDLKTCFALIKEAFSIIIKENNINMSMGYTKQNRKDFFYETVDLLLDNNCFIICAASENISFPATLKNVITVSDLELYKKCKIKKTNNDFIVDVMSYKYHFIPGSYTSYAAPFVTAKTIMLLLNNNIQDIKHLKTELSKYFTKWSHS